MGWFLENWDAILVAITSLVTTASFIAGLTPTTKDDKFIAKIVNILALNVDRVKK